MLQDATNSINKYDIRSNPPLNQSVKEASLYLGISERKLRDVIARGEIKYARLGSRIILRLKDLNSFLEGLAA